MAIYPVNIKCLESGQMFNGFLETENKKFILALNSPSSGQFQKVEVMFNCLPSACQNAEQSQDPSLNNHTREYPAGEPGGPKLRSVKSLITTVFKRIQVNFKYSKALLRHIITPVKLKPVQPNRFLPENQFTPEWIRFSRTNFRPFWIEFLTGRTDLILSINQWIFFCWNILLFGLLMWKFQFLHPLYTFILSSYVITLHAFFLAWMMRRMNILSQRPKENLSYATILRFLSPLIVVVLWQFIGGGLELLFLSIYGLIFIWILVSFILKAISSIMIAVITLLMFFSVHLTHGLFFSANLVVLNSSVFTTALANLYTVQFSGKVAHEKYTNDELQFSMPVYNPWHHRIPQNIAALYSQKPGVCLFKIFKFASRPDQSPNLQLNFMKGFDFTPIQMERYLIEIINLKISQGEIKDAKQVRWNNETWPLAGAIMTPVSFDYFNIAMNQWIRETWHHIPLQQGALIAISTDPIKFDEHLKLDNMPSFSLVRKLKVWKIKPQTEKSDDEQNNSDDDENPGV